jgi:hypothetical protein
MELEEDWTCFLSLFLVKEYNRGALAQEDDDTNWKEMRHLHETFIK